MNFDERKAGIIAQMRKNQELITALAKAQEQLKGQIGLIEQMQKEFWSEAFGSKV